MGPFSFCRKVYKYDVEVVDLVTVLVWIGWMITVALLSVTIVRLQKKSHDSDLMRLLGEFRDRIEELEKMRSERERMIEEERAKRLENFEKFLLEQGRMREEIEKKRDQQLFETRKMIEEFVKTVSGTKTRGKVGEEILKEVLKHPIRVGLVKTNLKTEGGEVEFAWSLGNGKFIPIDCKLPEVGELLKEIGEGKELEVDRKQIVEKMKREIERVKKYRNSYNTVDSCILVVPEIVLEAAPELITVAKEENVYICTFKDVIFVAHMLQERYELLERMGRTGEYKRFAGVTMNLLAELEKKIDSIGKAINTAQNALEKIRTEIGRIKREWYKLETAEGVMEESAEGQSMFGA